MHARRGVARLGVFALLLQAILFGWHHHALPCVGGSALASVSVASSDPGNGSADDDRDCDICFGLHHCSAAGCDFVALRPPPLAAGRAAASETVFAAGRFAAGFRARAPPLG